MDWYRIIIGGIIGWLVSWFFYQRDKEKKWYEEFDMDKQRLSHFLGKLSFEMKLILEQLERKEKMKTVYHFRRLINEDPFTLSYGEKNLTESTLEPVLKARELIGRIKKYVEKGDFNKVELLLFQSEISRLRIQLVGGLEE